jgi:hypothetical protein
MRVHFYIYFERYSSPGLDSYLSKRITASAPNAGLAAKYSSRILSKLFNSQLEIGFLVNKVISTALLMLAP